MTTPSPDDATARVESDAPRPARRGGRDSQFAPGTIIAGRYRISGIVGAGGMGEVYRADDIKLDQTVALKFLPARLARDPVLLGRLLEEVRLGHQITHPNVCRIHDIVEWEGTQFVAMEFVEGEDLSRLLRRIGRLAHDKAVDIARGIAAGLHAAHAKGILHRDLKPANVMIDSHGEARIMDFGLALAAGEDDGTISGTPAYMAPEQLAGQAVTVQSDLYALGLVMYELFTGKRAHEGRTIRERLRDSSSEITTPSSVIREIDPSVERIILRCLSNDPMQRPRSAREVIESLPGGDPLMAALAAGETPSPGMVAAAGIEGSLRPAVAWTMLGLFAAVLALYLAATWRRSITRYTPMSSSPEVLQHRAEEIAGILGIPVQGQPTTWFFNTGRYLDWLEQQKDPRRWEVLRNGPALVRYRLRYGISPKLSRLTTGRTSAEGWTTIEVDPKRRLAFLLATPAQPWKAKPLDWNPLLIAAGLEPQSLRPATPTHTPAAPFDARAAWTGAYPGDAMPIRIEASAWRGTPTFFSITGAWDAPGAALPGDFQGKGFSLFLAALYVGILGSTLLLAWRNLRTRRGDRQGALRVALAIFALFGTSAVLGGPYLSGILQAREDIHERLGAAALSGVMAFLLYMALEPYARRKWPELLISWSRLISGRVRDPLVGRDVLIGLTVGMFHAVVSTADVTLLAGLSGNDSGPQPVLGLGSLRQAVANTFEEVAVGTFMGFLVTVLLVLSMLILRRRALAAGALMLSYMAFYSLGVVNKPLLIVPYIFVAAALTFINVRYGLLAAAMSHVCWMLLFFKPWPGEAWIAPAIMVPLLAVMALAIWAFHVSLGGQRAFGALDE